jgi:hypothetical protein
LLRGAAAAFVHGCVPTVHTSTAGETVRQLHARLESRLNRDRPTTRR